MDGLSGHSKLSPDCFERLPFRAKDFRFLAPGRGRR